MPSQPNAPSRYERLIEGFVSVLGPTLGCAIILLLVGLITYPLYRTIVADGHVDYCFTDIHVYEVPNQPNVVLYSLWGFRPWCFDRRISSNLPSLEAAKAEADRIGCPMK